MCLFKKTDFFFFEKKKMFRFFFKKKHQTTKTIVHLQKKKTRNQKKKTHRVENMAGYDYGFLMSFFIGFVIGLLFSEQFSNDNDKKTTYHSSTTWCYICEVWNCQTVHSVRLYTCHACLSQFFEPRHFLRHMIFHGEFPYKCCKCDKKFQTRVLFNLHKKHAHTPIAYQCDTCHIEFKTRLEYVNHKKKL